MGIENGLVAILTNDIEFKVRCLAMPEVTRHNRSEIFEELCNHFPIIYTHACSMIENKYRDKANSARASLEKVKKDRKTGYLHINPAVAAEMEELKERLTRKREGKEDKVASDRQRFGELKYKVGTFESDSARTASALENTIRECEAICSKAADKELSFSKIDDDVVTYLCERVYKPALDSIRRRIEEEKKEKQRMIRNFKIGVGAFAGVFLLAGLSYFGSVAWNVFKPKKPEKPAVVETFAEEADGEETVAPITELPEGYEEIIKKTPVLYERWPFTKEFEKAPFDELELKHGTMPVGYMANNVTFLVKGKPKFVPITHKPKEYFDDIPDVIYSPNLSVANPGDPEDLNSRAALEKAMGIWLLKKFYYDIAMKDGKAKFRAMNKLPAPEATWMLKLTVNKRLEGLYDIVYTVHGKEYPSKFGESLVIDAGPVCVDSFGFRAKFGEKEVNAVISIGKPLKNK
jgi:hypothetical protein